MQNYCINTYGCQMNYSDTERIETYLKAIGLNKVEDFSNADLIIFNTCSIRQKAEDRVYSQVNNMQELRKTNPGLKVVITGCMVRESSSRNSSEKDKLFKKLAELDIALRIEELPLLANLIREVDPKSKIESIEEESLEDYFQIKASYSSKSQAFVPVSTGCDKFCTYCIVPYSRGRERSRSIEEIFQECEQLVENGCLEITLIGQTVNSYGLSIDDKRTQKFKHLGNKEPFIVLLEQLDKLSAKGLKRVRFTSSHPKDMSDQLIDAMANLKTQMPYLHLPVQSGDDRTLKRMNRNYTTGHYREIIRKLREKIPDISISTDIIVGFCDENEEEFKTTCEFFKEMGFEHAFHAQYSQRTGTFAARYIKDNIPNEVKKTRWEELNDILKEASAKAHARFQNRTVEVLVENQEGEKCIGRSEHYKIVNFNSGRNLLGKIVPVKITEAREWVLNGELA